MNDTLTQLRCFGFAILGDLEDFATAVVECRHDGRTPYLEAGELWDLAKADLRGLRPGWKRPPDWWALPMVVQYVAHRLQSEDPGVQKMQPSDPNGHPVTPTRSRARSSSASPALPPMAMPVTYRLSLLPNDHPDSDLWAIYIRWRGQDRWAVENATQCLGVDGSWDLVRAGAYIDEPAEQAEWLATHRFDLRTALRLAEDVLPTIRWNGITAPEMLAREAASR